MKRTIRLTESDLHRIVRETVNRVLNEYNIGGVSLHGSYPGEENGDFKAARDFNTLKMLSAQTKSHANEPAEQQAKDSMDKHLQGLGLDDKSINRGSSQQAPTKWAKRNSEQTQLHNASVGQYNQIADKYNLSKPYAKKKP